MKQDQLFLLRPSFPDLKVGTSSFHCPSCARIEGLLSFFPFLRHSLIVHYVAFPRPRSVIVELIGEENQSCPVLVLSENSTSTYQGILRSSITDRSFIIGSDEISLYLAETFGISSPHP